MPSRSTYAGGEVGPLPAEQTQPRRREVLADEELSERITLELWTTHQTSTCTRCQRR